jgi:putative nucleotidyltransferase with HDIG domain
MVFTLSRKLILSFTLIIALTMTIIGLITYDRVKDIMLTQITERNEKTVSDVNEYYLKPFLSDMEYIVDYWANEPGIVRYRNEPGQPHIVTYHPEQFNDIYKAWKGVVDSDHDIAWIYLGVAEDGSAFFAPNDPTMPESFDSRTRPWYVGAEANPEKIFWTSPYPDANVSSDMLVTVSKLVKDDDYTVGVMALDIRLAKFSELLRGLSMESSGYLMIVGSDGNIYAHPDQSMILTNIKDKDWGWTILDDQSGSFFFMDHGKEYICSYTQMEENGWKLACIEPVDMDLVTAQIKNWILSAIILVAVGLIFVSAIVTLELLRPLTEMRQAIRSVIGGNFDARMKVSTRDELGILSETFNRMIEQVDGLMKERQEHIDELTESFDEIKRSKLEITALYEQAEAFNEELKRLLEEVQTSYRNTAKALGNAIEANDNYVRGHCDRVSYFAMKMASKLPLGPRDMDNLEFASMLHDIGKLGIPQEILNKPSKLTTEEFEIIKQHPRIGYEILEGIIFLEDCREILYQHHEWVDGTGYPRGMKGDEIHYSAKILGIADAYDAMTSARSYRNQPMTIDEAINELERAKGSQFDEKLVEIFIEIIRQEETVEE